MVQRMGTGDLTAQVHPARLTHALLQAAEQHAGSKVQHGIVQGIEVADGAVTGAHS